MAANVSGQLASSYQQPVGAADNSNKHIAAGYRALFTCSATFHGNRELEQILEVELHDTKPLGLPAPVIDHQRRRVSASDGNGDVRTAVYRPNMGCTLLPGDIPAGDAVFLPSLATMPTPEPVAELPTNIDPRFDNVLDAAFTSERFGSGSVTSAVIVIRGSSIVAERYGNGFSRETAYRTWSTAKSITAAMIGIAEAEGLLDLDEPAAIPEFASPGDPRANITWRHLLTMSSGLYSQGANTSAVYFGGQDAISSATSGHLEAEPGSRWKYANNDTLLLLRGLRHVLNDDEAYLRFAYESLLHPIGMHRTVMETDHAGNLIGSSQVYTTPRDLARFGLLLLNDGVWEGQQILPSDWIDTVTTPAPAKPQIDGQQGYGGQFWLLNSFEGIPADTYTTAGNKGQLVTVIPSEDLVIVRTGVNPNGIRWNQVELVRAVLEAQTYAAKQ
ncbi:MAG: beta-lactamase family protein [Pseudomonadaceae bacterium]|nr:beta-lactamase family protein [Pseudomonadaceae bacterium]